MKVSLGNEALVLTILGDFKLSDILVDKIIEMIAEEQMMRDELTQTEVLGDQ